MYPDTGSKVTDVIAIILAVILVIVLAFLVLWAGCEIGRFVYDTFGVGGLGGFCAFLLCGSIASNRG